MSASTDVDRRSMLPSMISPLPALIPVATTFASGLRASAVALPGVHTVVLEAHVRLGPRFETAADNGISHFLEHMLYRGTARHGSAHDQALAFEALGGSLGAATYVDHMTLGVGVPPENLDEVLPLFCEVFRAPLLTGIETEKGIVREEILEGLDDEGHEVDADNLVRDLSFGDHPLGFPITGTLKHLDVFDESMLRRHHAARFVGNGTTFTIAGPVDPERMLAQAERLLGDLPQGSPPETFAPAPQDGPRFRHVRHSSSQTDLRVAFRAPAEHDPDEPAVELLLRSLDDGMSARLYHRLCDSRGLCYDVSATYEAYSDTGLLDVAAEAAHERAEEVLSEILRVLTELRDEGPSDAELDRIKRRLGWQLREILDSPAEAADFLGLGQLTGLAQTPQERYEQLSAVTRSGVQAAAERLFRRDQLSVVAVGMIPRKTRKTLERMIRAF